MGKVANYGAWLNENDANLDNFIEDFDTVIRYHQDLYKSSYSALARNEKSDPEEDFHTILLGLKAHGWDREEIVKIIKANASRMQSKFGECCGAVDLFLYRMGMPKHPLSGYNYKDAGEDNVDENFIKYEYGYHRTKYGILAIEQHFGTIDSFLKITAAKFADFLIEDTYGNFKKTPDSAVKAAIIANVHVRDTVITIDLDGLKKSIDDENVNTITKAAKNLFGNKAAGAQMLEDNENKMVIDMKPAKDNTEEK
jgi:hypothetical protein